MLISFEQRNELNSLFEKLRLIQKQGKKKESKINQILSYLEIIVSNCRKLSRKRALVFADCCSGKCYLSFLAYYYFTIIEKRDVVIHCIDFNRSLIEQCRLLAEELGFNGMIFHYCSIDEFNINSEIDMVYSLHACNTATDSTIYLGARLKAKTILSVSCCQFDIRKKFRSPQYRNITRHSIFRDKMIYMVGDSLRAMLLEMNGYQTDIFEFTSTRNTDKNIMLRARRNNNINNPQLSEEYLKMSREFRVKPELENYLDFNRK